MDLEQMAVEVRQHFDAPPGDVFALLRDVERMAGLGPEHHSATWTSPTTFTGRNRFGDTEWEVPCVVVLDEPPTAFGWTVGPPEEPASTWTYRIEPSGEGTLVTQRFVLGPGKSRLRHYCAREPEKAERFIAWRTEALRDNMTTVLQAAAKLLGRP